MDQHLRSIMMRFLFGVFCLSSTEHANTEEGKCPELGVDNGRWFGSRSVGGEYTLLCQPGFYVLGTDSSDTAVIQCLPTLEWSTMLSCADFDSCANLTHHCGPTGDCVDKIGSYDCLCERGATRVRAYNGEIYCSAVGHDCAGHTCGSHGICIDLGMSANSSQKMLVGMANQSLTADGQEHALSYSCHCPDGSEFTNGTCVEFDCGPLEDPLGEWFGSSKFSGHYTLLCPPGTFVLNGAHRQITVTCPLSGHWSSIPVCIDPVAEYTREEVHSAEMCFFLFLSFICVCCAAVAAGLTLGLAAKGPFDLAVILYSDPEDYDIKEMKLQLIHDQQNAREMLPLVKNRHELLVALMLFNTLANESLPLFLGAIVSSFVSVLLSVTVVLMCGEILPSALFTGPQQFRIASRFVPWVQVLMRLLCFVTKPMGRILDLLIGAEESVLKYTRAGLVALLEFHVEGAENSHSGEEWDDGGLTDTDYQSHMQPHPPPSLAKSEMRMMSGALTIHRSKVGSLRFSQLGQCLFVDEYEKGVDVIASGGLLRKPAAVLVIASGEYHKCDLVSTSVVGCLLPRDLLRASSTQLREFCSMRRALQVSRDDSVLAALRALQSTDQVVAVVVHGSQPKVEGVVTRHQLLAAMMMERPDHSVIGRHVSSSSGKNAWLPSHSRSRSFLLAHERNDYKCLTEFSPMAFAAGS